MFFKTLLGQIIEECFCEVQFGKTSLKKAQNPKPTEEKNSHIWLPKNEN